MSVRSGAEQSVGATTESPEKRARRRRLPLSCGECRSKKTDSFSLHATVTGLVNAARGQAVKISAPMTRLQNDSEEVRRLRREVANLKSLVSQRQPELNNANVEGTTRAKLDSTPSISSRTASDTADHQSDISRNTSSFSHPKDRSPQGYYAKHSLFKFFTEITQFVPFITEVTDEWLRPAGVKLKKQKTFISKDENLTLDALLPPQGDADQLVAFYLDNYEHLHRIVHVPTFKKQYHDFWLSDQPRSPAIASLIMSIMAVSASAPPIGERYQDMAPRWSVSVDEWLRQQSPKRYELVHYQVLCLSYLAKRMNQIHKKLFWTESSNLLQRAILDELPYNDSVSRSEDVFKVEMRRRIWHVIRELELQNSYEFGLPTLLHNIDCNLGVPANINDEELDECCTQIPQSRSANDYTQSSYQIISARSWSLRLEISRRLSSPAIADPMTYDDVIRYTHQLTSEIAELPTWDTSSHKGLPSVVNGFLKFQLMECVLAIHRPYLGKDGSAFWLSENICHQMSRETLLVNCQISDLGLQPLTRLREDLMLASLTLTRVVLLQSPDSTSIIMSCSNSIIELMERCLAIAAERSLRCSKSEPWCFISISAAISLLKVHLGILDRSTAKYSCAQAFLNLHKQHPRSQTPQQPISQSASHDVSRELHTGIDPSIQQLNDIPPYIAWLDGDIFDFGLEAYNLDMNINGMSQSM
ncbi:hypothetical protein KCU89_g1259, partial [Aureobasidium melanogenum]